MEKKYTEKDLLDLVLGEDKVFLSEMTLENVLLFKSEMLRSENNLKLSFKIFICELIQLLVKENNFCVGKFINEIKEEMIELFYKLYK